MPSRPSRILAIVGLMPWISTPAAAQYATRSLYPAKHAPAGMSTVQEAPRKSPALAAALSGLVFPGVGSCYAGSTSHGIRHLAVASVSAAGAMVLLAGCDSDGSCDFHHDGARLEAAIGLGAAYLANCAWSVLTAISDAERANMSRTASRRPSVRMFRVGDASAVGVTLATVIF
jgi:hypothetical protein